MAVQKSDKSVPVQHVNGPDIRVGGRPKNTGTPPIHPHMANRTNTTVGAPPTAAPPDASSPNPLDPTRTKAFPIPKASWDAKGGDGQGVDPAAGHRVMAGATTGAADFAKSLHTELPSTTSED